MYSEIDPEKMKDLELQTQFDKRKAAIAFKTMALKKSITDFKVSSQHNKQGWELDLQHNYGTIAQFVTEFKHRQQGKEQLYTKLALLLSNAQESAGSTTEISQPLGEALRLLSAQVERVNKFDLDACVELPKIKNLNYAADKENRQEPKSPHITILSANDSPISCSPVASSPPSSPRSFKSISSEVSKPETYTSVSYAPSSFFESVVEDSVSYGDSSVSIQNQSIPEVIEETKQPPRVPPISWKRQADPDTSLSSLMEKSLHTEMTDSAGAVEWDKYWSKGKQYEVEVKRKASSWKRLICPCFHS